MSSPAEPHAGDGGAGAPPPETSSNKVPAGLTRAYVRPELRVQWFASRCIHAGRCIRALATVFDPQRRPWIDITAEEPDAIADAVMQCPTGALKFQRLDGGPDEVVPDAVQIVPVRNGPYFVHGPIDIVDPSTGETRRETRVALCRCGQSRHMPFCDNTHRAIGFRSSDAR
ncbi:MAG TPA: CDGSH iron-sulfur domain-containing protein [Gemmatimonadaceae bacterium]|nr:CDGSH iron-sulfur domain-containing protein [Gemmatimonadaceae bacterium]